MKGKVMWRVPKVLQPLLLQALAFEYYKKLFHQSLLVLKQILLDPGASASLPLKGVRAFVRAKGVVRGRRPLFCYHADCGAGRFVMTT